ncbi:amidohydrolase family protein [Neptunicella sp. SCSIO 80796]|uniref:amidohydrolase family protein n=1 Tax=Neptunicella plasticusilytica TaxID=3117012 RepID=UPI003A4D9D61
MLSKLLKTLLVTLPYAGLPVAFADSGNSSDSIQNSLLISQVVIANPQTTQSSQPVDVLIENERISRIEPNLKASLAKQIQVIEGKGYFLAPGLIDSHTHLGGVPGMTGKQQIEFPNINLMARQHIPLSYLYYGFTSVVDLNSAGEDIEHWNKQPLRPQAYFCGAAPVMDGYPTYFIPEQYRYQAVPNFIVDETHRERFASDSEYQSHRPKAAVKRIQQDGAICVKSHYESGFGGHGNWPVPSLALLQELVAQAHQLDLPVLLHANSQQAQQIGVKAGVDAFAHGMWTWDDADQTELTGEIRQILDAAIVKNIKQQPTFQVLYGERDLHDPEYLQSKQIKQAVPAQVLDWYQTDAGQFATRSALEIPYIKSFLQHNSWQQLDAKPLARLTATVKYLDQHTATDNSLFLFGSDTPSDLTYANPTGYNGYLEAQRWRDAGISALQWFRAATINNARFFGLEQEIGSISVDKRADLLLLSKDPRTDYAALDSIKLVVIKGKVVERQQLSAQNH